MYGSIQPVQQALFLAMLSFHAPDFYWLRAELKTNGEKPFSHLQICPSSV
jgi:hypothetical protein